MYVVTFPGNGGSLKDEGKGRHHLPGRLFFFFLPDSVAVWEHVQLGKKKKDANFTSSSLLDSGMMW